MRIEKDPRFPHLQLAHLPAPEIRRLWPTRQRVETSVLSTLVERRVPAGMTSTLTRRRGEPDEDLAARRAAHTAEILSRRVEIIWRA